MRILVTGAESSGKSTASKWLSRQFNLARRPEYARSYLNQLNRTYSSNDIVTIASTQHKQDLEIIANSTNSIHDTGAEILLNWYRIQTGHSHHVLEHYLTEQQYDLCFLMAPNLPWEPDPLREHPNQKDRMQFTQEYKRLLEGQSVPLVVIDELGENRLAQMKDSLENHPEFQK